MTFEEILQEYGIETAPTNHEHNRPGWVNFDCPFCSPRWRHWRMGYNIYGNYVNCWACGRHRLAETLEELLGLEYELVSKLLKDMGQYEGPRPDKAPRGHLVLPPGIGLLQTSHEYYLRKKRGFKVAKVKQLWEIRGIGMSGGLLSWRIWIPIFYKGDCVSWTTRSINDKHKERYKSASAKQELIDHKELLYGEDYCRNSIVVCEGPLDVWKLGPGATATFGTTFSRAQVEKIAKYPVRAVCYDSSEEAQKQARELCNLLEVFPGETHNIILDSKDPGAATKEEILEIRRRFLQDGTV